LSLAQKRTIRADLNRIAPDLESSLRTWLQGDYAVEVSEIGETSSQGLFEALEDPIVVNSIEVNGAAGWVVWENTAAIAAATVAMSCELEDDAKPRALTPLESGLVGDLLMSLTEAIASSVGLRATRGPLSQTVREFLSQLDTDANGDPQRLYLHLILEGPGGPSTLRLYLPGVLSDAPTQSTPPPALPSHLNQVPIELSAELGRAEIALDDLMELEVGDVIPLAKASDSCIDLVVEGEFAGTASWGNLNGQVAVRIEQLSPNHQKSS